MQTHFNLNELNHFKGSNCLFQHWGNHRLLYTEGIQCLANKLNCYWLIEEIAYVILPQLLQYHPDHFYCIRIQVHKDNSAKSFVSNAKKLVAMLISPEKSQRNVNLNYLHYYKQYKDIGLDIPNDYFLLQDNTAKKNQM